MFCQVILLVECSSVRHPNSITMSSRTSLTRCSLKSTPSNDVTFDGFSGGVWISWLPILIALFSLLSNDLINDLEVFVNTRATFKVDDSSSDHVGIKFNTK